MHLTLEVYRRQPQNLQNTIRIVGKAHLTFEEMQTTLCEIETILNSRPLLSLSADPNDLAYLSPGYFLVGMTLNGLPCVDLSDVNENRLLRWQRVEQIRQHFWRRWSNEYLHSLQARTKWMASKGTQLSTNQFVLIRQPNLIPLQWAMGRVLEGSFWSQRHCSHRNCQDCQGQFLREATV